MRNTSFIPPVVQCLTALFLGLCAIPATAQSRPDSLLHEVKVTTRHKELNDAKATDYAPGQKITTIDSTVMKEYRMQSLANMLAQQEPVFIKTYGFNGLATLNFRGSSAAQSAVLWNGIPIQNAALGLADVSTLPAVFMNKVGIAYGSSSALWGSGNVGGALLLETEPPVFDSGYHHLALGGGIGSFGQYLGNVQAAVAGRHWYLSANVFTQTAQNNFPYTTEAGTTTDMTNSRLRSYAAQVQAAYQFAPQNTLSLVAWYQQYERQIPPALFETGSVANEQDGSLRLLLNWQRRTPATTWYVRSSLIQDNTEYHDASVDLNTRNTVYQYYHEVGWQKDWYEYGRLLLFMPIQISWMPQDGKTYEQDRVALSGAYAIKALKQKLDVAVNARGEDVDGNTVLLPGADASYTITRWLSVRANVQKTYRVPTLNELYYNPGGNSGLRPEEGWNEDAGYTLKLRTGSFTITHDLSVFDRDIHNWILWLGGAIWTPHNVAEVHSRGIATESIASYTVGNWKLHLGVNTEYVLATTEQSYIYNDGSIGKQLPYTPRYSGRANVGFTLRHFTFNYNHTYTGYRFTTVDQSEYILPYQTGNVQLLYDMTLGEHNLQLSGQCNNIWNEQYQIVAYRPMPGINWLAGLRLELL
jgi:vitamin B12 transporter